MIFASIGASGSGKTHYGNELKEKIPNLEIVCPDDIRSFFGDVSSQSKNGEVFNIINHQLEDYMKQGKSIYYSATNLTKKSRKALLELCNKYNQSIIFVVFLTSFRPDICENRVNRDLLNGVNRSNTMVRNEKGETVIQAQAKRFRELMRCMPKFREEVGQYCKEFRIKYIECASR